MRQAWRHPACQPIRLSREEEDGTTYCTMQPQQLSSLMQTQEQRPSPISLFSENSMTTSAIIWGSTGQRAASMISIRFTSFLSG
jgi:hypothetical protein